MGLLLVQVILNTHKQTKARSNDSVTVSVAGQKMGVLPNKDRSAAVAILTLVLPSKHALYSI